mgnify:FL=1
MTKQNKKIAVGVLWIFSGSIILVITILLNVIFNFVFKLDGGVLETIVNLISWLFGLAGLLLLVAGPIIGVIILAKKTDQ